MEQMEYLASRGVFTSWLREEVIPAFAAVRSQMPTDVHPQTRPFSLTPSQLALIGGTYNTALYTPPVPRMHPVLDGPVLNPNLDLEAIQDQYEQSDPHIVTIDHLLSPLCLERVRRICLESTVWYNSTPKHPSYHHVNP